MTTIACIIIYLIVIVLSILIYNVVDNINKRKIKELEIKRDIIKLEIEKQKLK